MVPALVRGFYPYFVGAAHRRGVLELLFNQLDKGFVFHTTCSLLRFVKEQLTEIVYGIPPLCWGQWSMSPWSWQSALCQCFQDLLQDRLGSNRTLLAQSQAHVPPLLTMFLVPNPSPSIRAESRLSLVQHLPQGTKDSTERKASIYREIAWEWCN